MLERWIYNEEGLVNATQIIKDGNIIRERIGKRPLSLRTFLVTKDNQKLMQEIEEKTGMEKAYTVVHGCKGATWMEPGLALVLTLSISPKVKYDCLHAMMNGFNIWEGK